MDADTPVTDVVMVTSLDKCPPSYIAIATILHGHSKSANLWEKVLGGEDGERYLCYTKEEKDGKILEDIDIPSMDTKFVPRGFSVLKKTTDGRAALYHRDLIIKRTPKAEATHAIVEIIVASTKDRVSELFNRKLHKVNKNHIMCRKVPYKCPPSGTTETAVDKGNVAMATVPASAGQSETEMDGPTPVNVYGFEPTLDEVNYEHQLESAPHLEPSSLAPPVRPSDVTEITQQLQCVTTNDTVFGSCTGPPQTPTPHLEPPSQHHLSQPSNQPPQPSNQPPQPSNQPPQPSNQPPQSYPTPQPYPIPQPSNQPPQFYPTLQPSNQPPQPSDQSPQPSHSYPLQPPDHTYPLLPSGHAYPPPPSGHAYLPPSSGHTYPPPSQLPDYTYPPPMQSTYTTYAPPPLQPTYSPIQHPFGSIPSSSTVLAGDPYAYSTTPGYQAFPAQTGNFQNFNQPYSGYATPQPPPPQNPYAAYPPQPPNYGFNL